MATFSKILIVSALTLPVLVSCGSPATPAADTGASKEATATNVGVDPAIQQKLDKRAEEINAITDLKSLGAVNPYALQDAKKDAPKFIEYQKKQMLFGLKIASLRTPEYIELEKKRLALVEYRDKWPKELTDVDAKIKTLMADRKNPSSSDDLAKLVKQRQDLMKKFQSSTEYQDYMKANKAKIEEANQSLLKFNTPEIQSLQKEVAELRKEVYGK